VAAAAGTPHAMLIRALAPIEGLVYPTHGPGLLRRSMHIDRSLNRADLLGDTLWIERPRNYRPPRAARMEKTSETLSVAEDASRKGPAADTLAWLPSEPFILK